MTTSTFEAGSVSATRLARPSIPTRRPVTVALLIEAIRDGLAAAHHYHTLHARGISKAEAAERAVGLIK